MGRRTAALFERWLRRRMPPSGRQRLGLHQLFILPSPLGWSFLACLGAVFVLGTNYQNNLILMLAFVMASLFVVAIWLTYNNIAGLVMSRGPVPLAEVGSSAAVVVTLFHPGQCYALDLRLDATAVRVDAVNSAAVVVSLPLTVARRGRQRLPRLQVQSLFPLGLLRCWTTPDLELEILGAPRPQQGALTGGGDGGGRQAASAQQGGGARGMGDFSRIREFQGGDPLNRIAWKQMAQGRGLLVKEFADAGQDPHHLSLAAVQGDIETRLAVLAYWVARFHQRNESWSLSLGGSRLGPDCGPGHWHACQRALALYGEGQ